MCYNWELVELAKKIQKIEDKDDECDSETFYYEILKGEEECWLLHLAHLPLFVGLLEPLAFVKNGSNIWEYFQKIMKTFK